MHEFLVLERKSMSIHNRNFEIENFASTLNNWAKHAKAGVIVDDLEEEVQSVKIVCRSPQPPYPIRIVHAARLLLFLNS